MYMLTATCRIFLLRNQVISCNVKFEEQNGKVKNYVFIQRNVDNNTNWITEVHNNPTSDQA